MTEREELLVTTVDLMIKLAEKEKELYRREMMPIDTYLDGLKIILKFVSYPFDEEEIEKIKEVNNKTAKILEMRKAKEL